MAPHFCTCACPKKLFNFHLRGHAYPSACGPCPRGRGVFALLPHTPAPTRRTPLSARGAKYKGHHNKAEGTSGHADAGRCRCRCRRRRNCDRSGVRGPSEAPRARLEKKTPPGGGGGLQRSSGFVTHHRALGALVDRKEAVLAYDMTRVRNIVIRRR